MSEIIISNDIPITSEERLDSIKQDLLQKKPSPVVSTREFLSWFGAQRRGYWVNEEIRNALLKRNIQTVPDFLHNYIDANMRFVLISSEDDIGEKDKIITELIDTENDYIGGAESDPAFRVGRLESANKPPISVSPDTSISEAVTIMMINDFSQLPVLTNERDLKGAITWESIACSYIFGKKCEYVRDCMKPCKTIDRSDSLFRVIETIVEHSFVVVRNSENKISGLITTSDLSRQFRALSEPFLLLSEIEKYVRRLIDTKFTAIELNNAMDKSDSGRAVNSVSDLNFGEYLRLMEDKSNWTKLKLALDRKTMILNLHKIRSIRNDVMHFDPDGVTTEQLSFLRHFAQFLREIDSNIQK